MATEEPVVLPYLTSPETRYNAVPRRYEETRPVVVQNFAHRKIIGKHIYADTCIIFYIFCCKGKLTACICISPCLPTPVYIMFQVLNHVLNQ